jgi:hypothetical protein
MGKIFFAVKNMTLPFPSTHVGVREISVVRKQEIVGRDWERATNILCVYIYIYTLYISISYVQK